MRECVMGSIYSSSFEKVTGPLIWSINVFIFKSSILIANRVFDDSQWLAAVIGPLAYDLHPS